MNDPLAGLVTALDLTNTGARTSEDIFTGVSQWMPLGRVFGGQVLAQSLVAAMRTTRRGPRRPLHARLLPPARGRRRCRSRSRSTGCTTAGPSRPGAPRRIKSGQPILSMIASFQTAGRRIRPSAGHAGRTSRTPSPCRPTRRRCGGSTTRSPSTGPPAARSTCATSPTPIYFTVAGERVAHQAIWMKATGRTAGRPEPAPGRPGVRQRLLASGTGASAGTAVTWGLPGLKVASLDHAMWWHRFGRVDEWLLYVQESPNAHRRARARRWAGSTAATACCWPASPRRAWCGSLAQRTSVAP